MSTAIFFFSRMPNAEWACSDRNADLFGVEFKIVFFAGRTLCLHAFEPTQSRISRMENRKSRLLLEPIPTCVIWGQRAMNSQNM